MKKVTLTKNYIFLKIKKLIKLFFEWPKINIYLFTKIKNIFNSKKNKKVENYNLHAYNSTDPASKMEENKNNIKKPNSAPEVARLITLKFERSMGATFTRLAILCGLH